MDVLVGMPCHHPAWPVRCDRCGGLADGFQVTRDRMVTLAWLRPEDGVREGFSVVGVACRGCNRVVVPLEWDEPPADWIDAEDFKRAVREAPVFAGTFLCWVDPGYFQDRCLGES